MADALPYRILSVVYTPEWDPQSNTTVSGKRVKALWLATQDVISVFVPDTAAFAAGADQLIRAEGSEIDKLYTGKA